MKASALITAFAAAVVAVNADSISESDQAIWIERLNYFRTTGLPWSASNMRRIGWDADLATKAASAAAKCLATTTAGVNAYQSTSSNATDIIDEAIQQWVVETAVQTLKTMAQPGSSGLDVGTGVYNSYSQVVWASTNSVGCATSSCSGEDMVVCEFSPPGNDGKSAWYKHGSSASECPEGTIASEGLCIEDGSDANNQIAPIPAGEWTYQVYPAFVVDIHSVLIESAREIDKGSASTGTQSNNTSTPAPKATTAVQSASKGASTSTPSPLDPNSNSSSSSSSSAPTVTQDGISQGPGTVKASSDSGSTFQNEVNTPSTQHTSKSSSTLEGTESLTSSTGTAAASHSMSTLGMVGMFILGIGAVAGIVMFVHYTSSTKRQNDILLDGGIPA